MGPSGRKRGVQPYVTNMVSPTGSEVGLQCGGLHLVQPSG